MTGRSATFLLPVAVLLLGCRAAPPQARDFPAARVYALTIRVPHGFHEVAGGSGPDERYDYHRGWATPEGKSFEVTAWRRIPDSTGGPMAVAKEEPVTVAGREVRLIRASRFQGTEGTALVVFLRSGDVLYRVHSRGIEPEEFKTILTEVRLSEE